MGKKIAIMYEKGGVGKTTTVVNVSAILAEKGFKTLIVDLDFQGYATGYFGLKDETRPGVFEVMTNCQSVEIVIIPTGFDNLYILPATRKLKTIETHLSALPYGQEYVLKNALKEVEDQYDYIIFDCPPSGLRVKTNAMAAADGLILPVIPDDFAIQGLETISEELVAMKRGTNQDLTVYGVLITIDENTVNKKAYKQVLQEQNILPSFKQAIKKNTTLSEAINSRKPIIHYDNNCNGAQDYRGFVEELLEVIGNG